MAIQIRDNKLHIDKVVIDNELVVEYVKQTPLHRQSVIRQ